MDNTVTERSQVARQLQRTGGAHGVTDVALGVVDTDVAGLSKHTPERFALLRIATHGTGGVRAENVDLVGFQARFVQRHLDALRLSFGIGQNKIGRVGVHRVSDQFAVNLSSACFRVTEPFERVQAAAFSDDDSVAFLVKRA